MGLLFDFFLQFHPLTLLQHKFAGSSILFGLQVLADRSFARPQLLVAGSLLLFLLQFPETQELPARLRRLVQALFLSSFLINLGGPERPAIKFVKGAGPGNKAKEKNNGQC